MSKKHLKRMMTLGIISATLISALSIGASASWRQVGQDWNHFNQNEDIQHDTNFDGYEFNSNGGTFKGDLIIINMNSTTSSAVSISFDSTTGSAVTCPINITTGSAVTFPIDVTTAPAVSLPDDILSDITLPVYNSSNFDDVINECNKEKDNLDNWANKINDKIDKQFDRAWNFMSR